jgi:hypothetical protein
MFEMKQGSTKRAMAAPNGIKRIATKRPHLDAWDIELAVEMIIEHMDNAPAASLNGDHAWC